MNKSYFLNEIKNYDHIIFDFGGIFININYQKMLENLSTYAKKEFDEELFSQASQHSLFSDFEMGYVSGEEFTEKLSTLLDIKHDHKEICRIWNSILLDIPIERIDFLKTLKDKKLYLLSNINSIHEAYIKSYLLKEGIVFYENFEKIYFSHHLGLRKPTSDIFEYVLHDLGIKSTEAIFIDDSIQHVVGSKAVGMHAIHLEKQNMFLSD